MSAVIDSRVKIEFLRPSVDLASLSGAIWQMLKEADHDFVPPLSARTDDASRMDARPSRIGPIGYFDRVMMAYMFLASIDDQPTGFISFRVHESNPSLPEFTPCTYITTTIVRPQFRRMGIGTMLNAAVENLPEDMASPWIARRMWSSNVSNLELMAKRGYSEVVRLPNHRGNGIDSIYMARLTVP